MEKLFFLLLVVLLITSCDCDKLKNGGGGFTSGQMGRNPDTGYSGQGGQGSQGGTHGSSMYCRIIFYKTVDEHAGAMIYLNGNPIPGALNQYIPSGTPSCGDPRGVTSPPLEIGIYKASIKYPDDPDGKLEPLGDLPLTEPGFCYDYRLTSRSSY